ncbi:MAG TPA: autotransporter outer membrane beta-barrel domain-containing protein, partial [Acetobacteraceae bacterium]|nr:autotransporter outer membrane beta-barrel domain-containing protein [Acetobacteraceae bacterium]
YGIWTSVGNANNTLLVNPGGSVSAASGTAIYQSQGSLQVTNLGTVTGSYTLGSQGSFSNAATGTLVTGASASAARTTNAGRLFVGPVGGFGHTTFGGDLVQTTSGTIILDADFAGRRAGTVTVLGNATLSGHVMPTITSVLPNIALPVLTVGGALTGDVAGGASTLFGYGVQRAGQALLLSATSADFTPAGFALSANRTAVADHLQAIWGVGGVPALGPLFALLGNTADAGGAPAYSAQLRQLSPDAGIAPGARAAAAATSFATAALSCPTFEGTTAMLVEGSCGWMRVTGRSTSQSGGGVADFKLDSTTWQVGGQTELAPGWLLGGSLAYETSWLASSDRLNKGNGQTGYGAVVLKYQTGPWLFAASAFGGGGQFNLSRIITLPGYASVAKGSPDIANVGMLLRAAYTIGQEDFYLRPNITLSTIHVRTGAYREGGGGALGLAIDGASQTSVALTPMLEVGGRLALGSDMLLRPFLAAGFSLQSSGAWTQTGHLLSAPAGAAGFATTVPVPRVAGRVTAGAQLYTSRMVDLRLQYEGEYAGSVVSHAGSFVASVRF